jgi:hypothetical protein
VKLLKPLLIAAGLLAYSLVFLEVFLRLANPQVIEPRYTGAAPWGVRRNIPGARYIHQTPRKAIAFAINGQGMRDEREFAYPKPAGTCRIEVFGDSFFMGYEVELPESFARRLQTRLRQAGYRVEVLNFSVSGFGQAEMLKTYEALGRRFAPDVVLSSWHYTDLDDNVRSGLYRLKDGRLESTGAVYVPSVGAQAKLARIKPYVWLSEHSQVFTYLREHVAYEVRGMLAAVRKAEAKADPGAEAVAQKKLSAALLRAFQAEAKADGAGFLAVEVPRWNSGAVLSSAAPLLDPEVWREVPLVSPYPRFEAIQASGRKAYFDRGGAMHMTPLANDDLAALVGGRLLEEGWLKPCAPR